MVNKKVIDILPPKEKKSSLSESLKEEVVLPLEVPPKKKKEKRRGKGFLFILLSFFLIALGLISYFTLSKAEITLWPELELISLESNLNIDQKIKEIDFDNQVIPGQSFAKEKTLIEVFSSSGEILKEEKAKGYITVYNDYSTASQVLIANTRFTSEDGILFRTPVAITVPGQKSEGKKLVPGEIKIEVVADQPGPEYNIDGPTKFAIPGFAGTDKYFKFYAESFEAIKGGLREERAVLTEDDLLRAEDSLVRQGEKDCRDLLISELTKEINLTKFNYFLNEIKSEVLEKFSLSMVDEEVGEFKFQTKTACQTLLFLQEDLINFAEKLILEEVPQDYLLVKESLKIDYSLETIDLESGQATLSLSVSAQTYSKVDEDNLKKALSGKALTEAKILLKDLPKISKVNVSFWPFWVRKVPEDFNKIKIKINLNL